MRSQRPEGPNNRGEIASNTAMAVLKTALDCDLSHSVKSKDADHAGAFGYGRLFRPSLSVNYPGLKGRSLKATDKLGLTRQSGNQPATLGIGARPTLGCFT